MLLSVYVWRNPQVRKRVFGTLRVVAYGLVVSAGLGALTIHNAVANVEQESLNLGRKLEGLNDLLQTAHELRLNGEKVFIASSSTDQPVATVLDRFEAHCNKSPAFDPIAWKSLGDMKGNDSFLKPTGMNRMGVVRQDDPTVGDGMVLCFTSDHGPKDFYNALQAFSASGNLHDLGDVRYVRASRGAKGTMVQTMWTEGSFNIKTLIGDPAKDTVGSDFATLPRPISSIRRFTAEAVGTPYSARIYESTATPAQVMDDYNKKMLDDDWVSIHNPVVQMPAGQDGRWYSKLQTGEQVVLAVNTDGSKTMASVASLGLIDKAPRTPQQ